MPNIIIPTPFVDQPNEFIETEPRIRFAATKFSRNHASGDALVFSPTAPDFAVNGISTNLSTAFGMPYSDGGALPNSFTVVVRFFLRQTPADTASTVNIFFAGRGDSLNANVINITAYNFGGGYQGRWAFTVDNTGSDVSMAAHPATHEIKRGWNTIVFTQEAGVKASACILDSGGLFFESDDTTTSGNIAYTLSGTNESLWFGGNGGGTVSGCDALFVLGACIDKSSTRSEMASLARDPWQIFEPMQRRIWVPSVGGGGANTDSAANSGSVAITGSTASALRSLVGVASSGSIAITGVAAVGVKSSAANTDSAADFGIISITGSPAAALRALQAASSQGSITITGVEAAGVKAGAGNTDTAADSGSITITGFATNGIRTLTSAATAGSVVLTGSAASGAKTIFGTANSGSITITGSDATVARTYLGIAGSGSVVITGSSAVGAKSGTISLSAADIQAIVDALMSDPRMLTLPKWIALR